MTNVLILGYGNIGKHIYDELKTMNPYIYDPNIPQYNNYPKINIDIAFVCVPTDSQADGSCDTSIVEKTIKKCNAEIIVIKSAIPVGTAEYLEKKHKKRIVVSPEYYGTTQHSDNSPNFLILGGDIKDCVKVAQIYYTIKNGKFRIIYTTSKVAEIAKYMEICFLALKVTFCNEFATVASEYDIPYEYIELELTESVFTENAEKLLKIMHKLHEIGFKLSLDDFGSGYSSLNMLKDMPVDVVKIDKEFFSDTMNTQKGRAVISTVVDLANNLDMDVISEGVETREQVEFLTEIHCAMVQGYYFAKPMPIADFEKLWYSDLEDIRRKKERAAAQQQARLDAHSAEHSGNAADKADSEQTEQGGQDAPAEAEDTSAEAKETEKNDGSEEPAVTTE